MFSKLEKEIVDFCDSNLPKQGPRAEYRKIYISFYQSLQIKYSQERFPSVQAFLSAKLSRFDIIDGYKYYIERSKSKKVTAATKYLDAMTYLYEKFFKQNQYTNNNLDILYPFASLKVDLEALPLTKGLLKQSPMPSLSEAEFDAVNAYIKSKRIGKKRISASADKVFLIWRLILIFGFKLERVNSFKVSDFNYECNTLEINEIKNDPITLWLPPELSKNLHEYILSNNKKESDFIFHSKKGDPVQPSYFSDHFRNLSCINALSTEPNAFNTTGLAKYAICQMLNAGLDTYFIQRITGMDTDVIQYCQVEVFSKIRRSPDEIAERDRKINEKLVSISTVSLIF